ncbi:hypothetical protein [Anaerovibrio sp. JC8]|uniref:hypothetical protein n=1 Tax=Anaerovibrio sp. JC8 TaxID=1240085 RepID=UPI000A114432|nr:hypothetical protein [Anaerovibrio sp. JC8]
MNFFKKESTEKSITQENLSQNSESIQYGTETKNRQYVHPYTKRIKKGSWIFLAVLLIGFFYAFNISTKAKVDNSPAAQEALESHISTTLAPGTKLLQQDGNYVGGDIVISHSSEETTTNLLVWDYAAEDGDYVQILANDTPLGEPFMIKNKPVSFTVPTTGEIQVVGTHDGGGGITYAVHYGMNNTTYFNGMNQGGSNTYTLQRE